MIAPRCVGCGGTVLELRGQFARLDSMHVRAGDPPPATAGTWHAACLAASSAAPRWRAALRRHLVEVVRCEVVAEPAGWTVVRNPRTREQIALSPDGLVLSLQFDGPGRAIDGGRAFPVHEVEYNLELDDAAAIAAIQAGLRGAGAFPVLELAEHLGIAARLTRPEALRGAAFRLEDPELTEEWSPRFVVAAVTYDVVVPEAVAALVERRPAN